MKYLNSFILKKNNFFCDFYIIFATNKINETKTFDEL